MTHAAKVIADSTSPAGHRLTTMEVVIPRIVLAEFNTHRMLSRNSASSRAIPISKMLKRTEENAYFPTKWPANQKGMQGGAALEGERAAAARAVWDKARVAAMGFVRELEEIGVHKGWSNRLLEPWGYQTIICTSTEWENYDNLRCHPAAHDDIRITSELMREARAASRPELLAQGEWHLPYIQDRDWEEAESIIGLEGVQQMLVKISSARCGRVSYLTHDGKRDLMEDVAMYDRLLQPGHMSPFEHPARPMTQSELDHYALKELLLGEDVDGNVRERTTHFCGNFNGWIQHRKEIPGEFNILGEREHHGS